MSIGFLVLGFFLAAGGCSDAMTEATRTEPSAIRQIVDTLEFGFGFIIVLLTLILIVLNRRAKMTLD